MSRAFYLVYLSPALLAVLGLGLVTWARERDETPAVDREIGADTFREALELIESEYVEDVSREDLIAAAVKGMTDALDRHSRGYDEEELLGFRTNNRGDEAGIGVHFGRVKDRWWVFRVVADGPADRAGVEDGDEILAIDGEEPGPLARVEDLRTLVVGEAGTTLNFRLRAWQSEETREVEVRRGFYRNEKVFAKKIENETGYLRLGNFDESSARRARRALEALRRAGAQRYVLDLRGNLGGSVQAAVDIVGLFVAADVVLTSTTRRDREVYGTSGTPPFAREPLVVLTDGESASASEIVAGALQDYERAVVIGEHSYGKGLMQNVFELRTRPLGLKFTVARWYTPAGRLLQRGGGEDSVRRGGILPDYPIVVSEEQRRLVAREWSRQRIRPDILEFMTSDPAFEAMPEDYEDPVLSRAMDWFAGRPMSRRLKAS
jgi:carboxyl-terminal processing protease